MIQEHSMMSSKLPAVTLRFQRILVILAIIGVLPLIARAQSGHEHYTCGSDWAAGFDYEEALERTRANNPAQYERMVARTVAREKGSLRPSTQAGADWIFHVTDRANPESGFKDVGAILRYNGDSILIWVDEKDNALITDATIELLAKGLARQVKPGPTTRNPDNGLVFNDMEIFGRPPLNRTFEEHIASFLLTDIEEPPTLAGGVIGGYFSPYDQTDGIGSNMTNILYIDSRQSLIDKGQTPGAIEEILGTMAHEFQHLINYGRYQSIPNDAGTHWIYNEGLSEVASIRNGYVDRLTTEYLVNTNKVPFFQLPRGESDTVLSGYERAMFWTHSLSEQFGDTFLYELTASNGLNLEPVEKAMQKLGLNRDVEQVFAEFNVANYIRTDSRFQGDPKYRYQFDIVRGGGLRTANRFVPTSPKAEEATVRGYASYFPGYVAAGSADGLKIRFAEGSGEYSIHAIRVTSNNLEVWQLEPEEDYFFEDFSTMVFVVVNLKGSDNTVRWNVEGFTSSVAEYGNEGEVFGFTSVVPHPVRGETGFGFRTAESGVIDLTLYDVRGKAVLHMLDDVHVEAGRHNHVADLSELPAGMYVMRLQNGAGDIAVGRLVVVE